MQSWRVEHVSVWMLHSSISARTIHPAAIIRSMLCIYGICYKLAGWYTYISSAKRSFLYLLNKYVTINVIENLHRYTAAPKINQTGVCGFNI